MHSRVIEVNTDKSLLGDTTLPEWFSIEHCDYYSQLVGEAYTADRESLLDFICARMGDRWSDEEFVVNTDKIRQVLGLKAERTNNYIQQLKELKTLDTYIGDVAEIVYRLNTLTFDRWGYYVLINGDLIPFDEFLYDNLNNGACKYYIGNIFDYHF